MTQMPRPARPPSDAAQRLTMSTTQEVTYSHLFIMSQFRSLSLRSRILSHIFSLGLPGGCQRGIWSNLLVGTDRSSDDNLGELHHPSLLSTVLILFRAHSTSLAFMCIYISTLVRRPKVESHCRAPCPSVAFASVPF